MSDWINWLAGLLGGALSWYFGGLDGLIFALLALSIIDYISGVSAAFTQHELSSDVGFTGIARKVMIFCLVGAANVVDKLLFGQADTLRTAVIFFYIANETLSIIENAVKLGVPIPEILKDKLQQLHDTKPHKPESKSKSRKSEKSKHGDGE